MNSSYYANLPAGIPPPGVKPNFANPYSIAPVIIILSAVFTSLMVIVVGMRLFSKAFVIRKLGADDLTCIIAAIGSILHASLECHDTTFGYGSHSWDIRAITLTRNRLQELSALGIIYSIVILNLKLSISFLYLRLFWIEKTFIKLVWVQIVLICVIYAAIFGYAVSLVAICTDVNARDKKLCTSSNLVQLVTGGANFFTDIFLLGLPIHIVLRMKLSAKKKLGVIAIFASGFLATIVSLGRFIFFFKSRHSGDVMYNSAFAAIFTIIEINVGIMCASFTSIPAGWNKWISYLKTNFESLRSGISSKSTRTKSSKKSQSKGNGDEFVGLSRKAGSDMSRKAGSDISQYGGIKVEREVEVYDV